MNISRDDEARHRKIVVNSFMKELCRLDDEANRGLRDRNDFPVEEIWQGVLGGYKDREYVLQFLREHRLENRDKEPFDFLDGEQRVRLTDAGRNRCDEYRSAL